MLLIFLFVELFLYCVHVNTHTHVISQQKKKDTWLPFSFQILLHSGLHVISKLLKSQLSSFSPLFQSVILCLTLFSQAFSFIFSMKPAVVKSRVISIMLNHSVVCPHFTHFIYLLHWQQYLAQEIDFFYLKIFIHLHYKTQSSDFPLTSPQPTSD